MAISLILKRIMNRTSLIFGILILFLGILYPIFQKLVLRAAFGIDISVINVLFIILSLVLGASLILIYFFKITILQGILFLPSILFLCVLLFYYVHTSWTSFIGPKCIIQIPNDFSGEFRIQIDKFISPSFETKGKIYKYMIEDSNVIEIDEGWLSLTFSFDNNGRSRLAGPYFTQIVREGGVGVHYDDFDADWIGSKKGIKVNIKADRGGKSQADNYIVDKTAMKVTLR